MEQKKPVKWWHRVVAFLVGYVAAGITFEALLILFAPLLSGRHGGLSLSPDVVNGIVAIPAIAVWALVYVYCMRNWWKPPASA